MTLSVWVRRIQEDPPHNDGTRGWRDTRHSLERFPLLKEETHAR